MRIVSQPCGHSRDKRFQGKSGKVWHGVLLRYKLGIGDLGTAGFYCRRGLAITWRRHKADMNSRFTRKHPFLTCIRREFFVTMPLIIELEKH